MKWFPQKKIIFGCESRGDARSPYLTRWTLLDTKRGRLYLHIFHRSDHDVLHDHPWRFWTLVLWRGYQEEVRVNDPRAAAYDLRTRTIRPAAFLFRPATHIHRVILHRDAEGREKPAVTLVWSTVPERKWGF
ncbi:MAG: hypothetical protein V4671_28205, partial [Armatimonadota bacterium]